METWRQRNSRNVLWHRVHYPHICGFASEIVLVNWNYGAFEVLQKAWSCPYVEFFLATSPIFARIWKITVPLDSANFLNVRLDEFLNLNFFVVLGSPFGVLVIWWVVTPKRHPFGWLPISSVSLVCNKTFPVDYVSIVVRIPEKLQFFVSFSPHVGNFVYFSWQQNLLPTY